MAQGLYEGPAFAIERFGKSLAVSVSEPSAVERSPIFASTSIGSMRRCTSC